MTKALYNLALFSETVFLWLVMNVVAAGIFLLGVTQERYIALLVCSALGLAWIAQLAVLVFYLQAFSDLYRGEKSVRFKAAAKWILPLIAWFFAIVIGLMIITAGGRFYWQSVTLGVETVDTFKANNTQMIDRQAYAYELQTPHKVIFDVDHWGYSEINEGGPRDCVCVAPVTLNPFSDNLLNNTERVIFYLVCEQRHVGRGQDPCPEDNPCIMRWNSIETIAGLAIREESIFSEFLEPAMAGVQNSTTVPDDDYVLLRQLQDIDDHMGIKTTICLVAAIVNVAFLLTCLLVIHQAVGVFSCDGRSEKETRMTSYYGSAETYLESLKLEAISTATHPLDTYPDTGRWQGYYTTAANSVALRFTILRFYRSDDDANYINVVGSGHADSSSGEKAFYMKGYLYLVNGQTLRLVTVKTNHKNGKGTDFSVFEGHCNLTHQLQYFKGTWKSMGEKRRRTGPFQMWPQVSIDSMEP